jgi:hypothetical protein
VSSASVHDRELVANVRPPDWVNPEPAERYHLVVVGGGTAGLVSAAGAAGLGARVALVERHLLGGDCLNVGCVPSKGVLSAARAWHDARAAAADFGGPAATGDGDFAAAMERLRRLRAGISRHDSARRVAGLGVDVFHGDASFVASDAVEVDGRRLRFRRAIIATGARAAAPPIPGLDSIDYLTNETLFDLTAAPAVLGIADVPAGLRDFHRASLSCGRLRCRPDRPVCEASRPSLGDAQTYWFTWRGTRLLLEGMATYADEFERPVPH